MAKGKKKLDHELNLVAFISLLSVLICALLLTTIWIQIGSMDVKQAVGGQTKEDNKKNPALWAQYYPNGTLVLRLQDYPRKTPRKLRRFQIDGVEGKPDLDSLTGYLEEVKGTIPDLRTALIQPKADTEYGAIISLMDRFKQDGMIDLGVAPL